MDSNLATYECIKLEIGDADPKVIDWGPFVKDQATLANARELLKNFHKKRIGVEAVRFNDGAGEEICRYSLQQLWNEKPPPGDPLDNGEKAFANKVARDKCPYMDGSKEADAWFLGWDTAPGNKGT